MHADDYVDPVHYREEGEPEVPVIGAGESVGHGRETALMIVDENDGYVTFQQPEFGDAWWFWARIDGKEPGCVEFGQMSDGKRDGSEHACDLDQLIALMTRVRDYVRAKAAKE